MIKISFFYDENGKPSGFEFSGHAGYAESGNDIVCAAVSAMVFNTINSIESFSKTDFEVEKDKKRGFICFRLKDEADREAEILLRSLILGTDSVRESYGKQFIRIEK
ncbi:MAG: ribosomal-processing cysteine protease Prp [Lachnospiraceae bacterium]|nr:ribosomal-processing cysteine protease Prp [Lachnospiraceae bacterium]